MKISLSTVDLSIGYQDKKNNVLVAQNINIKMALGKLVALVGPNGAGKSTLLRTLSGIQKPISGAVFLEDKNLLDFNNTALAKKVSVVLTEKLPPSNLSVYELVSLGRQPHTNWIGRLSQDDKQQIEYAISTTQINHLRDKKHYELSDGQLQKVMIARALAQNTPLIIFDEPTTHLDLEHKALLLALLQKLAHKAHKTILFSTHDIDLAIQLCDEIILMNKGFIQQDTPSNLMLNNHFDLLFENPNIRFDNQKQTFVLL